MAFTSFSVIWELADPESIRIFKRTPCIVVQITGYITSSSIMGFEELAKASAIFSVVIFWHGTMLMFEGV